MVIAIFIDFQLFYFLSRIIPVNESLKWSVKLVTRVKLICLIQTHVHVLYEKLLFDFTLTLWCTRLTAASDKVYQLLAHGQWFSPGTPASSTTKTGRHEIAEILLKVVLNTKNQIKSSIVFMKFQVSIH